MHPFYHDVHQAFLAATKRSSEDVAFFGPLNALLSQHFPVGSGFIVVPRPVPIHCEDEQFVFTLEFDVQYHGKTVLVVLVKPAGTLQYSTCRRDADKQIRARFGNIYQECPVADLHGLVFFGSKVAYYKINRDSGVWQPPRPMRADPNKIDLHPPESWWADDILQDFEAERLLERFGLILRSCRETDEA